MQRADDDDGIGSPIVLKLALARRGRTKDNFEPDWKRVPISVEIYHVNAAIYRAKIKFNFCYRNSQGSSPGICVKTFRVRSTCCHEYIFLFE